MGRARKVITLRFDFFFRHLSSLFIQLGIQKVKFSTSPAVELAKGERRTCWQPDSHHVAERGHSKRQQTHQTHHTERSEDGILPAESSAGSGCG